jgi:hypothetical protein
MKYITALISLSLVSGLAYANGGVQNIQGMASLTYSGKKVTAQEKQEAFKKAEQNAIVRYYAEKGDSSTENFSSIQQTVMSNLPNYILGASVISQVDHKSLHMYQISLQVQLNTSLLDNALQTASPVAATPGYKRAKIGFFFVARQVASARDYENRDYQRSVSSYKQNLGGARTNEGSESQSLTDGSIGVGSNDRRTERFSDRTSHTTETGGSQLRQATKYKYRLITSQNLDTVFEGDFAQAGFTGIPAEFIAPKSNGLLNVDEIKHEYESGRNIQPGTLANIANAMQLVQIPYFAIGSMNVGLPIVDPNTGLKEVTVTVDATIYNVESQFPAVIAAVGPEQFSGLGPTQQVALTNAIKHAANKTALDMVSRLNEKSVN